MYTTSTIGTSMGPVIRLASRIAIHMRMGGCATPMRICPTATTATATDGRNPAAMAAQTP